MDAGGSPGFREGSETRMVEPNRLGLVRGFSGPDVDPALTLNPDVVATPVLSNAHPGGHRHWTAIHAEAARKRIASESGSEYGLRRARAESVGGFTGMASGLQEPGPQANLSL